MGTLRSKISPGVEMTRNFEFAGRDALVNPAFYSSHALRGNSSQDAPASRDRWKITICIPTQGIGMTSVQFSARIMQSVGRVRRVAKGG